MTTKGTSKPYFQAIGASATGVTQSCYLVRFKKYVGLMDCGLYQESDIQSNYKANRELIKKIRAKDVDYVFLHELHIDHTGNVPALYAKGCHAHIYAPQGSTPFLRLLWEDSLKIHLQDCQKLQNKHGIKANPMYSQVDVESALNRIIEIPFNVQYQINPDITLAYYPAGHIVHSAQILLELKEGNIIKRIGFTGDIGDKPQPYVATREDLPFCNLLVGESTYNIPSRPDKNRDRYKDIEKIQSAVKQFNKILIPCFSLQRTQVMLKLLHQLDIDSLCPIYLDSPLASKFCAMWNGVDEDGSWDEIMSKVKVIDSYEGSMALQQSQEHCIIISASGFLTGGRIMNHLKASLGIPDTCVMFCGYAGDNNLASQIKLGQREVNVDGTIVQNRANIIELRSFSSHASYEGLMEYYQRLRYDKIALVHGEWEGKVQFAQTLQQSLINQAKSSRVICTQQDTKIYF